MKKALTADGNPKPLDLALGAHIKLCRRSAGISQSELAERCGISFQQIQKYERGGNRISFSRLVGIADALNISAVDLITPLLHRGAHGRRELGYLKLLDQPHAMEFLEYFDKLENQKMRNALINLLRVLSGAD